LFQGVAAGRLALVDHGPLVPGPGERRQHLRQVVDVGVAVADEEDADGFRGIARLHRRGDEESECGQSETAPGWHDAPSCPRNLTARAQGIATGSYGRRSRAASPRGSTSPMTQVAAAPLARALATSASARSAGTLISMPPEVCAS